MHSWPESCVGGLLHPLKVLLTGGQGLCKEGLPHHRPACVQPSASSALDPAGYLLRY